MKKIFYFIVTLILWLVLSYASVAWVIAEFDPFLWAQASRFFMLLIGLFGFLLTLPLYYYRK